MLNKAFKKEDVELLFDGIEESPQSTQALDINSIVLPSIQPRRYFDEVAMEKLTASIREKGILQPLLVRELNNSKYELIAGERRYRAATIAGLTEVPVIIREMDNSEAYELALMENLQREDLNPVEETEGILELLSRKLEKEKSEVISLFQKAAHPERQSVNNIIHSQEWKVVEQLFQTMGRLTPNSFRSNRLPLLKLPLFLLDALRKGRIEYSKARVIGRIKEDKKASKLLEEAIEQNLSYKELQERVLQLNQKKSTKISSLRKHWNTTIKKIDSSNVLDNPEKKQRIEEILSELEHLLNEDPQK